MLSLVVVFSACFPVSTFGIPDVVLMDNSAGAVSVPLGNPFRACAAWINRSFANPEVTCSNVSCRCRSDLISSIRSWSSSAHASDLRSQFINLIVIADLNLRLRLGLMIDQVGEGIIAKDQIGGGRDCGKRYSD